MKIVKGFVSLVLVVHTLTSVLLEKGQIHGHQGLPQTKKNVGNSNVRCNCGKEALIRTVKNGLNLGMKFYGCPLWPDTIICELEVELKNRDEKTKKLQSKKAKLEEDLKHMKN
ncbi:DNA topoisomerase 3-alpha, partial [Bienertia sinuspersici]